jgi:hypothetical protein
MRLPPQASGLAEIITELFDRIKDLETKVGIVNREHTSWPTEGRSQ